MTSHLFPVYVSVYCNTVPHLLLLKEKYKLSCHCLSLPVSVTVYCTINPSSPPVEGAVKTVLSLPILFCLSYSVLYYQSIISSCRRSSRKLSCHYPSLPVSVTVYCTYPSIISSCRRCSKNCPVIAHPFPVYISV